MTYLVCPLTKRPYILDEVFNEYCRNESYMTKQECEIEVCSLKADVGIFSNISYNILSFFGFIKTPEEINNMNECKSHDIYKWSKRSVWIVDDYYLVKSPVTEENRERRYLFFKYTPGEHGFVKIEDGYINISWAE